MTRPSDKKNAPAGNGGGSQKDTTGKAQGNGFHPDLQEPIPTSRSLTDTGTNPILVARMLDQMDLRVRCLALHRRAAIATIKMEYGLLSAWEQDELILEGKELAAAIELWRAYR
jgi:hypothetical protein